MNLVEVHSQSQPRWVDVVVDDVVGVVGGAHGAVRGGVAAEGLRVVLLLAALLEVLHAAEAAAADAPEGRGSGAELLAEGHAEAAGHHAVQDRVHRRVEVVEATWA